MKKKLTFIPLSLVLCALFLSACNTPTSTEVISTGSSPQFIPSPNNSITVSSSEQIMIVPDIAEVVFAVRTEAKTASDCQMQNTEDTTKVVETLKKLQVDEDSIQTSDYTMYPLYDYSDNTQKITGYEARTMLTVSSLPINNLGDILAKAVSSGINHVESITYQSSQYDASYQEALKLAVASAKTKAQALADASDCTLAKVISIVENSNYGQARSTNNILPQQGYTEESMALGATRVNIMPGEVTVGVDITVQFQIQ